MEEWLLKIMRDMINIDFEERKDLKNRYLLTQIGLQPRDLAVIYVKVIKEFEIDTLQVDLKKVKFDTFNHIIDFIKYYRKTCDLSN